MRKFPLARQPAIPGPSSHPRVNDRPKPHDRNKQSDSEDAPLVVVIETPRGSRNKYKLDEQTGRMKLSKVMPEGMVFPYDFGFIPGTKAEDGDPLDVLVLSDEPTFTGCQIDCRPVGVMLARQKNPGREEVRNDRIVAVFEGSVQYAGVRELADLEERVLKQVEAFFINYQRVRDVAVHPLGRGDAKAARDLIAKARAAAQ